LKVSAARQFHWYEIRRRRKSEGGQKFLPPNPLPFCPPERKLSKISVRIFSEKSSDFVQDTQPARKSQIRLARFGGLGDQIERNFGLKNQLAILFELNSK